MLGNSNSSTTLWDCTDHFMRRIWERSLLSIVPCANICGIDTRHVMATMASAKVCHFKQACCHHLSICGQSHQCNVVAYYATERSKTTLTSKFMADLTLGVRPSQEFCVYVLCCVLRPRDCVSNRPGLKSNEHLIPWPLSTCHCEQ